MYLASQQSSRLKDGDSFLLSGVCYCHDHLNYYYYASGAAGIQANLCRVCYETGYPDTKLSFLFKRKIAI